RRGFARQRTKPGLFCAILSASRKRQALQTTHNLRDMHTGRKHHHLDLRRQLLLAERLDELCNAGAGTVHLSVTSYHGATHALPRRSKWAQMLLNRSEPGKHESCTNFGNHVRQLFGVTAHLGLIVALYHHPHQRLGAGLAQQYTATPAHPLGYAVAGGLDLRIANRIAITGEAYIDQHLRTLV